MNNVIGFDEVVKLNTPSPEANVDKVNMFVKPFESNCDWFNKSRYNAIVDSYFRANQGDDTYKLFPSLSFW